MKCVVEIKKKKTERELCWNQERNIEIQLNANDDFWIELFPVWIENKNDDIELGKEKKPKKELIHNKAASNKKSNEIEFLSQFTNFRKWIDEILRNNLFIYSFSS